MSLVKPLLFMKKFLKIFSDSANELKNVRCLAITGLFIAISMLIEGLSIDIGMAKVNFAFLAIASIGMLFGPTVGFIAGLLCDVVGYIAHPDGAFLPVYILVAGLQGLIYGVCLYHKTGKMNQTMLMIRATIARLIDVIFVNLIINTALNMHYGFIPAVPFSVAVSTRAIKNLIELVADLPLLWILLPIVLVTYQKVFRRKIA